MTMRDPAVLLCLLTLLATLPPRASAQSDESDNPAFSGMKLPPRPAAIRLSAPKPSDPVLALSVEKRVATRRSPGWARFGGGFLTAAGAVIGIMAATYSSDAGGSDALGGVLYAGGTATGAMVGSAIATSAWEPPNRGLVLGALLGALPMVLAVTAENDDVVGWSLLAGVVGAPLGASIGQAKGRD